MNQSFLSNSTLVTVAVVVAIAICAALAYNAVGARNARERRVIESRAALVEHPTSIRVCVRAHGSNADAVGRAVHQLIAAASAPARIRVAIVAESMNDSIRQRYVAAARGDASSHVRRIDVAYVDDSQSQGLLQAWNLWHGSALSRFETLVVVVDVHRFQLRKGWDVAVEALSRQLPADTVFTASGPHHFPSLSAGPVELNFCPTVVPKSFVTRNSKLITPCIAVDPGFMVFHGASNGAARLPTDVRINGRCSLAEAGVAISAALFDKGIKFASGVCTDWMGWQTARFSRAFDKGETLSSAPRSATADQHALAVTLSTAYLQFADLFKEQEQNANADDKRVWRPYYGVGRRARMGLTSSAGETDEQMRKYGPASGR